MKTSKSNSSPLQDLQEVRRYYCEQRLRNHELLNIYQIWEKGGAFNDSITPSTYASEYRDHISSKLLSLTEPGDTLFSLGCGNGFVEADVAKRGRRVRAIDWNDEAVSLAAKKGVEAFQADYFDLVPGSFAEVKLVYGDGFLGHVFHLDSELKQFIEKLKTLGLQSGSFLVFSNDAPPDVNAKFTAHDSLANFWFLSCKYLADHFASAGFNVMENYDFVYLRPISGLRRRAVCIAQIK